jgi:hypothetical protein
MTATPALPYLDEHAVPIDAGVDDVWAALLATIDRSFSGGVVEAYTRVVGCTDPVPSGPRPLDEGATIAGFRVVEAVPPERLALAGRHRFSRYLLTFRVEPDGPDRSRLRAESRASFPGLAGALYRFLVIRSGGHVRGTRRLLDAVRRRAGGPVGPGHARQII